MIIIAVIVAAVACLVVGVTTNSLLLEWIALGLCVLGLAVVVVTVVRHRLGARNDAAVEQSGDATDTETDLDTEREPEPIVDADADADAPVVSARTQRKRARRRIATDPAEGTAVAAAVVVPAASHDDLPGDGLVFVVPGRRRYHRAGCRLLAATTGSAITVADAVDEEFTPCTVCSPTPVPAA